MYTHTYQCNQFSEQTTAETIEAWNYILKRIDHKEKHMRPDVCIQKHYPVIVGRRHQYCDDLKSKNRKRVKVGKTFSSIAASLLILLYAAIYKGQAILSFA